MPKRATQLNDALSDYYETRLERLSINTREAHVGQLERMRDWVSRPAEAGPNCLLIDVDDRMMVRYFNRLRATGIEPSTFNNYRQYLRAFWNFCQGEAWISANPMRHIDPEPVPQKQRLRLSAQELLMLLEDASPRDRIALAIGMEFACRASEVAGLRVGNVNLTDNTLSVWKPKTKSFDEFPFGQTFRSRVIEWFTHYAETMGLSDWRTDLPNDWVLVPPVQFTAINVWDPSLGGELKYKVHRTYTHPERIVQRALERLGHETRREGFHTLRRSAARQFYEVAKEEGEGNPLKLAQGLLGHKNQRTTELYLGMTQEKEARDRLLRTDFLQRAVSVEVRRTTNEGDGLAAVAGD